MPNNPNITKLRRSIFLVKVAVACETISAGLNLVGGYHDRLQWQALIIGSCLGILLWVYDSTGLR